VTEAKADKIHKSMISSIRKAFIYRFNLKDDQAEPAEVDSRIRDAVVFKGTNLWVLMLAIFIASIGLNVNSTAVIIGAMLISPLMGPIMGIGYGAGINDFELIKQGLKNLGIAILIGLLASTLYFMVTPLSEAQSELLSRTTPTIWDVLIALFGGMAGIVAATRKNKTNVIPGVAIATALMPPLCTAGYGIAIGSAHYFFGAFYLFFINCVFIAFSTILLITVLRLPHKNFVSEKTEKTVQRTIFAVVMVTVLPSIYLAYGLVNEELFKETANKFIRQEYVFDNTFVAKQNILPKEKKIEVTLIGENLTDKKLASIADKLHEYGLDKTKLVTHQSGGKEIDIASIRSGLLKDVLGSTQQTLEDKNKQILLLEKELFAATAKLTDQQQAAKELYAQYPAIKKVAMAKTPVWEADGTTKSNILIVELSSKNALGKADKQRIGAWLKVKMGVDQITLSSKKI
jgi:uncharacterized hydrophobic protein (TIGR00271 family)